MPDNKDKDLKIDESILDEDPPNINEPQTEDDKLENQDPNPDPSQNEEDVIPEKEEKVDDIPEGEDKPTPVSDKPAPVETPEEREKKYHSQQTETQIQIAKNNALKDKITEAKRIGEPTMEELKAFVAQDGVSWDELTTFEQSQAKRTYISEKKLDLITKGAEEQDKIDEWANKIDTFIDTLDANPKYAKLSGHEADFRKFSMKEAHRGTPIEVLLGAFLNDLPAVIKKRGSLFESGSGGEKEEKPGKITDADAVQNLRITNPREYRRQVKAGKIDLEI